MNNYRNEISNAINACNNALYCLNNAKRHLSSAANWGVVDVLGGGFLSTLIKHSKLDDAKRDMQDAKNAVQSLKNELVDVSTVTKI